MAVISPGDRLLGNPHGVSDSVWWRCCSSVCYHRLTPNSHVHSLTATLNSLRLPPGITSILLKSMLTHSLLLTYVMVFCVWLHHLSLIPPSFKTQCLHCHSGKCDSLQDTETPCCPPALPVELAFFLLLWVGSHHYFFPGTPVGVKNPSHPPGQMYLWVFQLTSGEL